MPTSGAPLGTPLGHGQEVPATNPSPIVSTLSRYINPATKSYEIDPDTGHLAQMPPVRQRVLIALSAVKGSSSVLPNLGIRRGGAVTARTENRLQHEVRGALREMVEEGVLRIERIFMEELPGLGRIRLTVQYTDLTAGLKGQKVTVLF